ncbi:hypothetical protein [Eggerthella sinensis]|uniref:hypothetical protein n=1 Tax=Eggerthella sinensis TaxID=242230 RepID=UPI003A4D4518
MAHTRKAQLFLVGIGFASFLAMNSFSLWGFSFLPQSVFGENAQAYWSTPLYVSNIVAFFGYFLGTTRFPHLFNRAPFVEAVLLMSAGMIFLLGYFLTWSLPMLSASGVLVGLGTTCCFISWEKVLSLSVLREAKKQIILGSVLSLLPFGLFSRSGSRGCCSPCRCSCSATSCCCSWRCVSAATTPPSSTRSRHPPPTATCAGSSGSRFCASS